MTDIYRRYPSTQQNFPQQPQKHQPQIPSPPKPSNNIGHHTTEPHSDVHHSHTPIASSKPRQAPPQDNHTHIPHPPLSNPVPPHKNATEPRFNHNILYNLIPKSLYNPETKKILGFLTTEDFLLIALIFLFLEDNREDNPLMALALAYVLFSDYINLDNFLF